MFLACLISFLLAVITGPLVIKQLKKFQFGQSIREEGPQSHKKKAGTPTLGGIIFLVPIIIASLIFLKPSNELYILLLLTVGYGIIGFLDDFIKIRFKRNLGLTAKQKIFLQLIVAGITYYFLHQSNIDTALHIPHTEFKIDLGWGYLLFFVFLTVGTTNATNLTDGLDGLLTGLAIIAFGTFTWISFVLGQQESFIFSLIMVGSLIGFLIFNSNPAKVFMGDTGSLALGGALVGISILTKTELLLAIVGGVFVLETLSVILQVASYKTTKRRIFRMTPIHHSFELLGWSEQKVVTRFWFVGLIFSLISLSIFSI